MNLSHANYTHKTCKCRIYIIIILFFPNSIYSVQDFPLSFAHRINKPSFVPSWFIVHINVRRNSERMCEGIGEKRHNNKNVRSEQKKCSQHAEKCALILRADINAGDRWCETSTERQQKESMKKI